MGMARSLRLSSPFLLVALLAAVGCSSRGGTISGKVYFKGEPLPGGKILFQAAKADKHGQQTFPGDINSKGEYTVSGVPDGPATVAVETESIRQRATQLENELKGKKIDISKLPPEVRKQYESKSGNKEMPGAEQVDLIKYVQIPQKYGKPETSGLTYTVKPGKQEQDFTLEK